MFKRYISLRSSVEAVQFTNENKDRVVDSLTGGYTYAFDPVIKISPVLRVTTDQGDNALVRFGDWLVKGGREGRYHPVENSIFCARYQVAQVKVKQTAVILWQTEDIEYYLIDGDYTHLSGAYINSGGQFQKELTDLFYNEEGEKNYEPILLEGFREALLSPDTALIQCGEHW